LPSPSARRHPPQLPANPFPDPDGSQAGDANLYRYVNNDAVNCIDPSGRMRASYDNVGNAPPASGGATSPCRTATGVGSVRPPDPGISGAPLSGPTREFSTRVPDASLTAES
jgi:hypothetical protein